MSGMRKDTKCSVYCTIYFIFQHMVNLDCVTNACIAKVHVDNSWVLILMLVV